MYDWIGAWANGERGSARLTLRLTAKLPLPLAYWICAACAWLVLVGNRQLRQTIALNMEQLLAVSSKLDRRVDLYGYYKNLCATLFELIVLISRIGTRPGEWNPLASVEGEDHLRQVLAEHRGAIVFAPHMGNFFAYYWYLSQHYDCLTVATSTSDELKPIYRSFAELGCRGLDYDLTPPLVLIRKLKHHLKTGGVVFLLGDFYRPHFPEAAFFGRQTPTPRGAAMLALELNVPIIPMVGCRSKHFTHRIQFLAPVRLRERFLAKQQHEATVSLNAWMEQVIRLHPEQWFYWFQVEKRWQAS